MSETLEKPLMNVTASRVGQGAKVIKHQGIALVIPAYNEAGTIAATMAQFYAQLPEVAIWVINNNSSDDTAQVAQRALDALGARGGVMDEPRQGKGNAVRRGFLEVDADIYILVDADTTYSPVDICQMVHLVASGQADMVVGDRGMAGDYKRENKRKFHLLGNNLVRWLVNRLFDAQLMDIMSGYRVFSRRFIKNYPITVAGFEIETDMTLHALDKKFAIREWPVEYKDRPEGSFSKLSTFKDGYRVLKTIFNILRHYRPLIFFGSIALLLAGVSGLTGWLVIEDFLQDHYVNKIPMAVLSAGIGIVAIVFFAIALILDTIVANEKRNFEKSLHKP